MNFVDLASSGALASLVLEGLKLLIRLLIKNPTYDFPKWFYVVSIPVVTLLLTPLLAFLGFEGFTMPTDWVEFARQVAYLIISGLVTLGTYKFAIKPLKEYVPVR